MSSNGNAAPSRRPAIVEWLVRANAQVSQWAASTTWWRLILLFLVILVASSMVSRKLGLEHDRVRVPGSPNDVVVTIGGEDGIRVDKKKSPSRNVPASQPPGVTGATGTGPIAEGPAASGDRSEDNPSDKARRRDDDDEESVTRRVVTLPGILGDLLSALLIILFAYLVAAKVVVRKVAESDAKLRSALHTAERETIERQLVQARLQVLQAQVEPHFLFNTLAAVDYLIETDPPRASQMQKALITYLRGALPQMRQESSTLGRELSLIRSYLELIKMRIEDRLDVQIAVPADLEGAEFPPMMLQSIVENAIKHGIEPKPEGGRVKVTAWVQNDQLWVEVDDTGVGFVDDDLLEVPTKGTGLGLNNIRERLLVLYGSKARLQLRGDDTKGTRVRIGVPYRPAVVPSTEAGAAATATGTAA